jgi:hypothetical protein
VKASFFGQPAADGVRELDFVRVRFRSGNPVGGFFRES